VIFKRRSLLVMLTDLSAFSMFAWSCLTSFGTSLECATRLIARTTVFNPQNIEVVMDTGSAIVFTQSASLDFGRRSRKRLSIYFSA